MVKQIDKNEARLRRHRRVRNKISGTAARPRLDVFRSAKHIYAQIIDDEQGVTLVSASTMDKDFNGFGGNVEAAAEIGKKIAAKALEKVNILDLCSDIRNHCRGLCMKPFQNIRCPCGPCRRGRNS